MKRKTLFVFLLASILVLALAACKSTALISDVMNNENGIGHELGLNYESPTAPNELMGNASAERGAFSFYVFDGETVLSKAIFQSAAHRQGIIDELLSAPAARVTGWTLDDITLPIYGILMSTNCGHGIRAAWSNGFWITQTGDVYRFDFDFEAFIERQIWDSPRSGINFEWLPNAFHLSRDEEGWQNTFLTPAAELGHPPEGIEMDFVSNTSENVSVTLTNNNDVYWMYGVSFRVDVRLNDVWYIIPKRPANWMFVHMGIILEAGQTETKTYSLHIYGELPPGTYRLVAHDMYVIFEIN